MSHVQAMRVVVFVAVSVMIAAGFLVGIARMPAAYAAAKAAPTTKISVIAGKPTEFGFKLSKLEAPVGTVVFSVRNGGAVPHSFKVCTKPSPSDSANACVGVATKILKPNQSAVLTVVFKSKGVFEFLCTVPGHASAGMKGRIGIGEVVPKTVTTSTTTQTTTATTTTTATATKPPATEALIGNPTNGASVFTSAGCGSCHTLAAAHSAGTAGPSLDQLAPGQSVVVTQVTNGGFNMPAFASSLSSTQINDLASFVYQSTHQ